MQVSVHNQVRTFNLTAGKSLPEWLAERKKNKRATQGTENRVELMHDLEFPHSSRCMFRCLNGTNFFVAGDYPYRLKCFDVNNLSMKFSFNADMMILQGISLSPDYRKFVLRGEGRTLTFHNTSAIIDRVRVPHMQRSILYNTYTSELLSCGVSSEIFRINLETGAFVESYKTDLDVEDAEADGINTMDMFNKGPATGVTLLGGTDGYLEAWDCRSATCAARLSVVQGADGGSGGYSYLKLGKELRHISVDDDNNGLMFCCGDENGKVYVYDVRLQKPLLVKDHMNSLPIVKTYFFKGKNNYNGEANQFVVSADTRSVKIWDKTTGKNFTSIDSPAEVFDFMFLKRDHNLAAPPYDTDDSGVLAFCCDVPRVQVHFVPQLAPAPRWASFLDVMADEQRQAANSGSSSAATMGSENMVYSDYTFISQEKMKELGISANDMADGKVRPVMHGAFIENNLYRELQAVLNPSAFNKSADQNLLKKKKAKWDDRISRFKRVANADEGEGDEGQAEDNAQGGLGKPANPLAAAKLDPRFAKQMGNRDSLYALDHKNPEYKRLLQTIAERREKASQRRLKYEKDLFNIVPDTEGNEDDDGDRNGDGGSGYDDVKEQLRGVQSSGKVNPRKQAKMNKLRSGGQSNETEGNMHGESSGLKSLGKSKVTMFEVGKDNSAIFTQNEKHVHHQRKKQRAEQLTLEERLKRMKK